MGVGLRRYSQALPRPLPPWHHALSTARRWVGAVLMCCTRWPSAEVACRALRYRVVTDDQPQLLKEKLATSTAPCT